MTTEPQMFWAGKSPQGQYSISPRWKSEEHARKEVTQLFGSDWKCVRVEVREVPQ